MENQIFLQKFVSSCEIEPNRFSCLMLALTDARKITGRSISTGQHELNILEYENTILNPYSFIGVVNYLLILDMIGEVFKIQNAIIDRNKKNSIYKALKQFGPSIEDKDINTIIALRNSVAHNYGLINIPNSIKEYPTKRHKFTIITSETYKLIEYPISGTWDGDFLDKSDDSSTKISYHKLIDLIELVYNDLTSRINNGTVTLALKCGFEELKARFTILY